MKRILFITFYLCIAAGLFPSVSGAGSLDISVPLLVDLKEVTPFIENSSGRAPDDVGLHLALSAMYINLGAIDPKRQARPDYDPPEFLPAEDHLRKAMALAPDLALPYFYMGLLELHRQDHVKALEYFERALELNPKDVRIHQQIHTIHFSAQRFATSALFLENSIKALPGEANLYHRLAASYLAINDFSMAAKHARKSMDLKYDPETNNLFAAIYMKGGWLTNAESEYRKVLKRYPQNINAMLGMARIFALRNKPNDARRWISEVLSVDDENGEAILLLKEIQGSGQNRK